jgi:translation initiation factor IF-2
MSEEKQRKVKIYQISKDLNISHDTIMNFLAQKGYNVKSHMSLVSDEMMNDIMIRFKKDKDIATIHKKKVKEFKEKYGKPDTEKDKQEKKRKIKDEVEKESLISVETPYVEVVQEIPVSLTEVPIKPEEKEEATLEVVEKKLAEPQVDIKPLQEEKPQEVVKTEISPIIHTDITTAPIPNIIVERKPPIVKEFSPKTADKSERLHIPHVAHEGNKKTQQGSRQQRKKPEETQKKDSKKQSAYQGKEQKQFVQNKQKGRFQGQKKDSDSQRGSYQGGRFKKDTNQFRDTQKHDGKKTFSVENRKGFEKPFVDRQNKPRIFTAPSASIPIGTIESRPSNTNKRKRKKHNDEIKFNGNIGLEDLSINKKKKKIKGRETNIQDIDDAIKRTFAEMDETPIKSRSVFRKKKKKESLEKQALEQEQFEKDKSILRVTELTSVNELANIMNIRINEVMQKCFAMGMMVSINQRLDNDTLQLVADEFGYQIEFQKELIVGSLVDDEDTSDTLKQRAPVVTIMGHVDHGKTSLLDYIRNANVIAGEAGGITQHIGAYKVILENKKEITFIDTPGHEAFTSMRARGAKLTDIVVLVVAADDNVMPQTVEAISHALAASVPIIVAINKIDKPNANIDKIKQQLSERNILVEEWGGKYQCVEISAKFGKNVALLLEKILLEAEILDLKANPHRNARGVVIEAELDKGKGIFATVLVQKGTLQIGDPFIAGVFAGKVRAMFDERGNRVEEAKPSTPIQISGFDGIPQAGDTIVVLNSEKETKEISNQRLQLRREQDFRQVRLIALDDISQQIKEGATRELNIIVKGDVDGSVEALADSLMRLSNSEVKVRVIHRGVGAISESDVLLAVASQAVIIGFNVRPNLNARKLAEKETIEIRLYNIIYTAINDVKAALEGLLAPDISEEVVATITVREIFKVPKIGIIAGCYVQDGKITRNIKVRLIRDGLVILNQANISSLKRFKDDVREVDAGFECGIGLENYNDIKVGDTIEGFKIVEKKRKLQVDKN